MSEKAACSALKVTRLLRVHRNSRIKKWRQRPGTPVALIMKYGAFHLCITDSKWKLLPYDRYAVTHMKCVDDLHLAPSRYLSVLQKQTQRLVLQLIISKEVDNCSCHCYCKFLVCVVSLSGFARLELCWSGRLILKTIKVVKPHANLDGIRKSSVEAELLWYDFICIGLMFLSLTTPVSVILKDFRSFSSHSQQLNRD